MPLTFDLTLPILSLLCSRPTELLQHLFNKGTLHDMTFMIKKLRVLLGDQTFLEAYERTGALGCVGSALLH